MKIINKYECDLCGRQYNTKEEAYHCENMPLKHDRGVKVGDEVLITRGDGKGQRGKVTQIAVHQPGWGPASYDHAVFLVANVIDSWGSRQLSHDSYEVLP